jgi:predicted transcriptional regulator
MGFIKKAYDIARKKVFFCQPKQPLTEIAKMMFDNNIGSVLVRDEKKIIGIITVNDMMRHIARNDDSKETVAKDIMSSPVVTAPMDLAIDELVDEFNNHKVSRMVLLDKKGEAVGVVRDIAVYKYFSFFKIDEEVKNRFAKEYLHKLY